MKRNLTFELINIFFICFDSVLEDRIESIAYCRRSLVYLQWSICLIFYVIEETILLIASASATS